MTKALQGEVGSPGDRQLGTSIRSGAETRRSLASASLGSSLPFRKKVCCQSVYPVVM
jgi:hypothetical protein